MHKNARLLLLSTSTTYGTGYLDHAEAEIRDFLGGVGRVLFVPFALQDQDAYAAKARAAVRTDWDSKSIRCTRRVIERRRFAPRKRCSSAAGIRFAF